MHYLKKLELAKHDTPVGTIQSRIRNACHSITRVAVATRTVMYRKRIARLNVLNKLVSSALWFWIYCCRIYIFCILSDGSAYNTCFKVVQTVFSIFFVRIRRDGTIILSLIYMTFSNQYLFACLLVCFFSRLIS